MKHYDQVAAFILAGGVSSRMGQNKALLEFAGAPLIVETVRVLGPLVRGVTVVGSPELYVELGLRAISDQNVCGQGPLVGIASALRTTQLPWNLIVARDLPYLSAVWVDWLLSRATKSSAQVVLPQSQRGVEPLAAVYRRECIGSIDTALARGVRSVTEALIEIPVDLIHSRAWRRIDPDGPVLTNMNTPNDYQEARRWWDTQRLFAKRQITAARSLPGRNPRDRM